MCVRVTVIIGEDSRCCWLASSIFQAFFWRKDHFFNNENARTHTHNFAVGARTTSSVFLRQESARGVHVVVVCRLIPRVLLERLHVHGPGGRLDVLLLLVMLLVMVLLLLEVVMSSRVRPGDRWATRGHVGWRWVVVWGHVSASTASRTRCWLGDNSPIRVGRQAVVLLLLLLLLLLLRVGTVVAWRGVMRRRRGHLALRVWRVSRHHRGSRTRGRRSSGQRLSGSSSRGEHVGRGNAAAVAARARLHKLLVLGSPVLEPDLDLQEIRK